MPDTDRYRLGNIIRYLADSITPGRNTGYRIRVRDTDGVRTLQFNSPWIQGAMRLSAPDAIEIEYVQQMMLWALFMPEPAHICQLGLGAGTLTRFCLQHYPEADVTAVEISPEVVQTCHEHFLLPKAHPRLELVEADAADFVADTDNHGRFDVLQVDLYDAVSNGPARGSRAFYRDCAATLTDTGMLVVNIFCDYPDHYIYIRRLEAAFEGVAWLPVVHDSNIVVIAFKKSPKLDFASLYERADHVEHKLGLPARSWVDGLYLWTEES